MEDINQVVESEVVQLITSEGRLTTELTKLETELQQDPKFQAFLEKQTELRETLAKSAAAWKEVEARMIEHKIKSIKGEWGSITIAERISFDTTDELAPKFYKKTVNEKMIADTFKLTGKVPKGATPKYTKYITKRIK